MQNCKCNHCPLLAEDRECPGQKNRRVCERADPSSPEHAPGILKQILAFGQAVVQHVAQGMPMATDEQKNARLAICQACEHFRDGGRCHLCGCGLGVKAGWAGESCPIGKWLAEPHRV
jgi:hypothetical protein